MQTKNDPNKFAWELPPPRDPYLHLSIRRSTVNAFLGSLIVHVLALFVVPQQHVSTGEQFAVTEHDYDSLIVNLKPRKLPSSTPSASATIPEARSPASVDHRQKASTPSVLALNKSRTNDLAKPVNPVTPALPSPAAGTAPDMQAYVNAARARRQAAEGFAGRENAEAARSEREPSEDELRMAKVKRNLTMGTNGVFQILSMDARTAAFSFRGWTTDSSNFRREYIQVELGTNSDIEIATVRKMIELIRRYYKGDFNWDSQRLDRVVTLSARTEDNAGLEEFMLKEFFGARSRPTRVR